MTRFHECLPIVLKSEGGYVNHKSDHGGATNFGVTQRNFTLYLKSRGKPDRDVKGIQQNEVAEIYAEYWKAAKCDLLPIPLDLAAFDCAINSGASRAIKLLQRVLGVPEDGQYGSVTAEALREEIRASGVEAVHADYLNERRDFFKRIVARDASQSVFIKGWLARVDKLATVAA